MVSMISILLRQLIILVPLVYVFAYKFGLDKAWYASWISETLAMIYAVFCLKHEYIKKIRLLLPKNQNDQANINM